MSTWPFWVWIGLLIFNVILRIAMIGKKSEYTYTARGAIIAMGINGLMIWWLLTVMQHLC